MAEAFSALLARLPLIATSVPSAQPTPANRYPWFAAGDVNAFFGLMLDNLAGLVLAVGLLRAHFDFPANFALRYILPGTAVGVLVGDLIFTWMAFRLAHVSGRNDITAMPLGLDTPSIFAVVFFVLGPAYRGGLAIGNEVDEAARAAWQIGICCLFLTGLFKIICAAASGWIRRVVPRAGLLGSLAAVALVLVSFLPLIEMMHHPVAGLVSLGIILMTLVSRVELPARVPGALGALLAGGAIYYALMAAGWYTPEQLPMRPAEALWPLEWMEAFQFGWLASLSKSLHYLPVVLPFALGTVVGGIDCTESAAAVGDEYQTGPVLAVEGLATLAAALCGGVIQTTPYIGHPAYKAMGGRAGYTLATALFIGSAGLLGYFGYLYAIVPKAAIFPILIFVGLEITAQSFHATPRRHYTAVALACIPALASLVMVYCDQILAAAGLSIGALEARPAQVLLAQNLQTLRVLSGGFIITSLLWASALAMLIDRRLRAAAAFFAVAAVASLFGVIHSPLPGSPLVVPWDLPSSLPSSGSGQSPAAMAGAYAVLATLLALWSFWIRPEQEAFDATSRANPRSAI